MKKHSKYILGLGAVASLAAPMAAVISCSCSQNSEKTLTLSEIKIEFQRILDETKAQQVKAAPAGKDAEVLAEFQKQYPGQAKPVDFAAASAADAELQKSATIDLNTFTQETDITIVNTYLEKIAVQNAMVEAWNAAVERLSAPAQPTGNTPVAKTKEQLAEEAWVAAQSKVTTFKMMHEATYDAAAGIDAATLTKTVVREQFTHGSTNVDFMWREDDYKPMMFTASEITALKAWFDKVPSTTSFASNWSTYAQLFPATGDRLALHAMIDGFAEDHTNIVVNANNAVWESTAMTAWDTAWGASAPSNFLTSNVATPSNFYLASRAIAPVAAESYHYVMDTIIAPIVNADSADHHTIDIIKATPTDFAKITTTIQARSMTASNVMGQRYDVNTPIKSSTQTIDTMYQIEANHTPAFIAEEDLHQWFIKDWMAKN